jgi:hypothetical protein
VGRRQAGHRQRQEQRRDRGRDVGPLRPAGALIKPIAGRITSNVVAQYVISKTMNKKVKELYDKAVRP